VTWVTRPTAEQAIVAGRHRHPRRGRVVAALVVPVLALAAAFAVFEYGHRSSDAPSTVGSLAAGTTTSIAGGPTAGVLMTADAVELPSFEQTVVSLVNTARTQHGCAAVRSNDALQRAAREQALAMARSGTLAHEAPDGDDPGERLRRAGYDTAGGWAENIARGYDTPEAVMAGWMNSNGHRANILNCAMRAIGVGAARTATGEIYWAQDFGGR
jgi:uncharacterized protein YkwD